MRIHANHQDISESKEILYKNCGTIFMPPGLTSFYPNVTNFNCFLKFLYFKILFSASKWYYTGELHNSRFSHAATVLTNGEVLVTGGFDINLVTLKNSELYDPSTGQWRRAASMHTARMYHTSTLLTNGKVLITGGSPDIGVTVLKTCELYDPSTGNWTFTGSLHYPRDFHTATVLPNGKVLVIGGAVDNAYDLLKTCELYDASTGNWTLTGSMHDQRFAHTATLLSDGKVLVTGSAIASVKNDKSVNSSELYDPSSGIWTLTGSMHQGRYSHTATMLKNGSVLVIGGQAGVDRIFNTAELYNPITKTLDQN